MGRASARKRGPLCGASGEGGGTSPDARAETSGTTAMFEHAVIRRRYAGNGTLLTVAVPPVDVCEIQHCA